MTGILVLDKPKDMTSREAVSRVSGFLKTRRAGHTGTLDPFATGVLPICLGKATRVIPFLDEDLKEYEAVLRLGVTTNTMDLTGKVVSEKELLEELTPSRIRNVLSEFIGRISQVPPMFSALKKDGVRLHRLARAGRVVERPARVVKVEVLELLEYLRPYIRFFVRCSRGTYVRVLGSDIGERLGCGGHLVELRRLKSGSFSLEDSVSMDRVKEGNVNLIPLTEALLHIKDISVSADSLSRIKEGRQITKFHLDRANLPSFEAGDKVKILGDGELVSIAEALVSSDALDKLDSNAVVLKPVRIFN